MLGTNKMKNLLIIILVLFITNCFACKLDYTAQTDSTICLQEMVNNNTLIALNIAVKAQRKYNNYDFRGE